ncbi:hypothetical protein [[Mycoplasma] testudinis]|uniref:hypothetical protein n=1 Tax=[Mycoplasma] testudinis TaxID=33924 RepID=UPI0006960DB7|nr:hypothetical protein [[Mycoplasma] testudinis]
MKNWKLKLRYIFSFGIYYFVLKKRSKKHAQIQKTELTISEKIPFAIADLVKAIGTWDNVKNYTSTINTLKLDIINRQNVDTNELKKVGAKGIMWNGQNSLVLVFGDYAPTIAKELSLQDPRTH